MLLRKGVKEHSMVKRWFIKFLTPTRGDPHRPTKTYIWRKHIKLHRGDNAYVLMLRFLRSEITIILVTNLVQQAPRLAKRTAFFMNGTVVEIGDTDRMFAGETEHQETTDYIEGRFG